MDTLEISSNFSPLFYQRNEEKWKWQFFIERIFNDFSCTLNNSSKAHFHRNFFKIKGFKKLNLYHASLVFLMLFRQTQKQSKNAYFFQTSCISLSRLTSIIEWFSSTTFMTTGNSNRLFRFTWWKFWNKEKQNILIGFKSI